jgi:hypothetical protein
MQNVCTKEYEPRIEEQHNAALSIGFPKFFAGDFFIGFPSALNFFNRFRGFYMACSICMNEGSYSKQQDQTSELWLSTESLV